MMANNSKWVLDELRDWLLREIIYNDNLGYENTSSALKVVFKKMYDLENE